VRRVAISTNVSLNQVNLEHVVMSTEFLSAEVARQGAKWWVIDAAEVPVGRLATEAANILRGKNKPTYTPNVDSGDFVVVVNADKIRLTGNKRDTKMYRHHTGFIGHLKEVPGGEMLDNNPERAIQRAVRGMLPEGILGHQMLGKLKVYRGSEHPHTAQMPESRKIEYKTSKK
jgi:large subunit ribosomal protein L13